MWVFRYVRELFSWAFSRWRIHQAIVGLALVAAGIARINPNTLRTVGMYLGAWFLFLLLVVAPARLWHSFENRLRPGLAFIEHRDNEAMDPNYGVQYARVTVKNTGAVVLTQVEVVLSEIIPLPDDFMTLNVPLHPMHAADGESTFTLKLEAHRTVDLLSMAVNDPNAHIWHLVNAVPRGLPFGKYRMKLVATTAETTLVARWFKIEAERDRKRQRLSVELESESTDAV